MIAIIDSRSSGKSVDNLRVYVENVFEFQSNGITDNSISGHPDIFIYQDSNHLVVAPNAPVGLFDFLVNHNIACFKGKSDGISTCLN